jgi:hypothetical protein
MESSKIRKSLSGSNSRIAHSGEIADWLAVNQSQRGFGWLSFQLLTSWGTLLVLVAVALSSVAA